MANFISDEDMEKLDSGSSASRPGFISDDHMAELESSGAPEGGRFDFLHMPKSIGDGLSEIPQLLDSVSTAPMRSAIGAAQDWKNPISAAYNQFGLDPTKAPTGHDLVTKAGVSDVKGKPGLTADQQRAFDSKYNPGYAADPALQASYKDIPGKSPADYAGTALELAADPLLIGSAVKDAGAWGIGKLGGMFEKRAATKAAAEAAQEMALKTSLEATQEQAAKAGAEGTAKAGATISGGDVSAEQGGKLFEVKAPQSLEELRNWRPEAGASDLPALGRLEEVERILPDLQTKPLNYNYDMLENPKAMKKLKLDFENLPTDDAQKIAAYHQSMVNEAADKAKKTIRDIGGGTIPRDLSDAGNDFISTIKDKYNAEKDALGPAFEEIQKRGGSLSRQSSRDLIQAIGENTKAGKLLDQDEAGRFFLKKNTPRSGMSDQEHGVLSRVIDDLNDGASFKDIQNTRDFLRKSIDPANPAASAETSKLRSVLLNQLEQMSKAGGPEVANTFKAYAINERARENIEKIIGGKIESLDAMFAANPDRVVKKIFSNPNYSKIVGDYVGHDKLNEMISSYIDAGLAKAFDPAKGFNPTYMRNWLQSNAQFLNSNVAPETVDRLKALADYGFFGKRFLDEVNPSGTAASLMSAMEPKSFFQKVAAKGATGAISSEVGQRLSAFTNQKQATKSLNEALMSQSAKAAAESNKMSPKIKDYLLNKYNNNANDVLNKGINVQRGSTLLRSLTPKQEQEKPRTGLDKDALLQKTQGTKYQAVLQNAAQRGDKAVGATNFILQSTDPEYRKATLGPQDEDEDRDQ